LALSVQKVTIAEAHCRGRLPVPTEVRPHVSAALATGRAGNASVLTYLKGLMQRHSAGWHSKAIRSAWCLV
jgi:hypothetical protein